MHKTLVSRRRMMEVAGRDALGLAAASWLLADSIEAVAAPAAPTPPEPLNRFPRMVQEWLVARVREVEAEGNARRAKLATKADAENYVRTVREKILASFGPLPERTPLNSRITGTLERDAYRVEKVIFESRPGFPVTASLYIPKNGTGRMPGVVGTCGHSANGKCAEAYQSFAQALARLGYVVLIYDPLGQGERFQYVNEKLGSSVGVGVQEHLLAGNQQFLVGDFLGTWRAWDGIRALDYLLTRPEVDPDWVAVTGNSGGGTMTTWLAGVERRWAAAAPSCFVTTFRRNAENELPADTEQCPPRALALGLDHSDFIAAMAPRPVILLGKEKDYFDARGIEEAYGRLKRLYTLLGAPENIGLFIGPTEHGYTQENREAMYGWFHKARGAQPPSGEPTLVLEKDEDLWCTPKGQVAEAGARSVFSFTREKSQELGRTRKKLAGAELAAALTETLHLPARSAPPEYRILRPSSGRKYPRPHATCYAVATEPDIFTLVTMLGSQSHLSRPPRGKRRAVLYVAHQSTDAELREEPLVAELLDAEPDAFFFACDVRGLGESRPDTCGTNQFLTPYGNDYFYAIHGIMLDKPYVGQRTHDVLAVLDWLAAAAGVSEVHLAGKGWGATPAALAAVLSDKVAQVTLKNSLTSYTAVAEAERYRWPLSALLPGVLASFDLPDVYAELAGKKLRQVNPWGPDAEGPVRKA